jgi:CHASE1-domain containing sensor protein
LGIGAAIIGVALSFAVWSSVLQRENRLADEEFSARANTYFRVMQKGIDKYISDISAFRATFQASEHGINRREFQSLSDQLFRGKTAILSAMWIPRVTRDQRTAHELEAARDGLPGYGIKSKAADGSLSPAIDANEYFPLLYSSKEIPSSLVYGLDLNDGGMRRPRARPFRAGYSGRRRDQGAARLSQEGILRRNPGLFDRQAVADRGLRRGNRQDDRAGPEKLVRRLARDAGGNAPILIPTQS